MKTRTLCLLATLAIALAAPSASAFRYDGVGPLPPVPCPDLPPGGDGVVGIVLGLADFAAETTCTNLASVEAEVAEQQAEAEETAGEAVEFFLGGTVDFVQDGACLVLFGSPDGSDIFLPYSRDLCKEIVVGTATASMDLCRYIPCGW